MGSLVRVLSFAAVLAVPTTALAQLPPPRPVASVPDVSTPAPAPAFGAVRGPARARLSLEGALDGIPLGRVVVARQAREPVRPADRRKPVWRRIVGAAVGGTAGFFGGGILGAAIEGDSCHCDDPGLMGALIGAPVGAAAGGILGGMFLF